MINAWPIFVPIKPLALVATLLLSHAGRTAFLGSCNELEWGWIGVKNKSNSFYLVNFKSGWLLHPVLCQGISCGLTGGGGGQEWAAYIGPIVKRNVHQAEAPGQVLDALLSLSHSSPFLQFWLCDCLCDIAAKQLQEIEWTQKENLSPIKPNLLHDHGSPADVLMLVKRQCRGSDLTTSFCLPFCSLSQYFRWGARLLCTWCSLNREQNNPFPQMIYS